MSRLTTAQAQEILVKVCRQRLNCPSYRLGQGIFNLLPPVLEETIRGTESDFFYWVDDNKVMGKFYEVCVEGSVGIWDEQ